MELNKPSSLKRAGKSLAKPLSWLACADWLQKPYRGASIYLNCLVGKGSGGWDLDDEVKAAIKRIKRPDAVVFDVGANVGSWSQGILRTFSNAKVYMFEPSAGCQEIIRGKNLRGVTICPFAVGETAKTRKYYSSSQTDGSASFYTRRDAAFSHLSYQESVVDVRTLDEVIETEKIEVVDSMKMDIEGHELFALRGAKKALAAGKIRALSFEFGCGNINSRTFFRDFWELLTAHKYALYRITPSGRDVVLHDYFEDHEYFQAATNFVAELNK